MADMPVLGSYALGAAELAAYRDDLGSARELWAIGMRLGANVTLLFQLGLGARLAEALGDTDSRDAGSSGGATGPRPRPRTASAS